MTYLYQVAAVTTFLSAFLLFQVQPLIGKHILPFFGGGSMVWITALCFFMGALLIGYVYVLLLSRLSFTRQKWVHVLTTLVVVLVLIQNALAWSSPITPDLGQLTLLSTPAWSILLALLVSIGAPFFLLATTSSLLQLWYGKSSGREPFSLYAISNIGSLLGLLSYPFIFEPLLSTSQQGILWTSLFIIYLIGLGIVSWLSHTPIAETNILPIIIRKKVSARLFILWTLVASVPVAAMLASTNYISGFVASVPFIWVIPLSLYLISFIVTFRGGTRSNLQYSALAAALITLAATSVIAMSGAAILPVILGVLWAAFFAIAHYCHEWLYENRPVTDQLPWFYVALSLGGLIGSVAIMLATLVFLKTPIEFLIILVGVQVVALWHLYEKQYAEEAEITGWKLHSLAFFIGLMISALVLNRYGYFTASIVQERNFYGAKTVVEQVDAYERPMRILVHEGTTHGYQFLNVEDAQKPTSYYVETSGVGKAFAYLHNSRESISVGAIGLGVGTVSAYCRATDEFTFYEIDPEVIAIAQNKFSFLSSCLNLTIKEGDARQLLKGTAEVKANQYDLLIIDAYADDAVPTHLLTIESLALYEQLLAPGGIIAFHISSRYLNLLPVMQGMISASAFKGRHYNDESDNPYGTESIWTLLAKDETVFLAENFSAMEELTGIKPVEWTDTKNALLPIVRF